MVIPEVESATSNNTGSNHDDPLSIQSSDHPGMKLVSHIFEGTGFGNWKRSMLIALSAKNKIGFIDGTQPKPSSSSITVNAWQRCNDMVFSWILNALSSEIADSVLYCESAKDVWSELEDRYGQSNGAQLYAVQKKLSDFSQGNDSITSYFTKIKSVWDEIEAMGMNPVCSCTCTCGSKKKQIKYTEDQKIVQFLMGLNDSYTVIRGTILMQNPLPKLATVYNNLIQEERQRDIHNSAQFRMDSASFYARNDSRGRSGYNGIPSSPSFSQRQQSFGTKKPTANTVLECRYCKKPGHTIDKCYRLQNRGRKFAGSAHFDNFGNTGCFPDDGIASTAPNSNNAEGFSAAPPSTLDSSSMSANFAGNTFSSVFSTKMRDTWILDSGATDHMCSNKSLFSVLTPLPKPFTISLPNGQFVTIDSVGEVPISPNITLANVLFVPCFHFNLLSVAKLTKQCNSTIVFTPDACLLQDSSLKRPLTLGRNYKDLYTL
ncbi:hypothetical protein RND81_14G052800 [Saponaria officinalis]|uniref:Retrotransposon Copia-like N-terminal domain-containing protein n=1 Tax=Saponaria officinalis TaxID=3572 RepID=A0AAW1GL94_SAPOF